MRLFNRSIAAALVGVASVLMPLAAPAASAAPPEILVSTDGFNFAPDSSVQLFDDLALIVPGDVMAAQLWVRNNSSTTALMRVAVDDLVVPSPAFGAAITLSSTLNGFSHASSLTGLSNCQVIVQPQSIPAGGTVRVDFEVLMNSATSGSDAQGETASLSFVVTAHEWAAGPLPEDDGCSPGAGGTGSEGSSSPSRLPWTGAEGVTVAFGSAVALLTAGILFVVVRRRRRDDEGEVRGR